MKAYSIKITGDVQGVFYRHNAKKVAKKLNLAGWVKNNQDGSVEAFVQGEVGSLEKFVAWAHEGPPMATVKDVLINVAEPNKKIKGFKIN